MCGIFGIIGVKIHGINKKLSLDLYHRGPDDKGFLSDDKNNVHLGHTRLSIIDLTSQAHQPMIDEDGGYTIVYNGEIYNFSEIKRELITKGYKFLTNSDTEVILKSYIQWKEDCLKRFRGMFAFAIYDKPAQKLFIARDRFGIKPLYYSFYNNNLVFASEVAPIIKSGLVPNKISHNGLIDYHCFGSIQQPNTIYENLYSLMPASSMIVDISNLNYTIKKYYAYDSLLNEYDNIDFKQASTLIRDKLEEATKYHLVSDVEVGAFLSGGVDSSAVVALMSQYSNKPIKTFTIGFPQRTEVEDETEVAKYVAKYLKCEHHEILVDIKDVPNLFDGYINSLDQPSLDGFNTYIVSNMASKFVKVVLSGLGGDEIFAGYNHFNLISAQTKKKPNIAEKSLQSLHKIFPNRFTREYAFLGMNPYEATILQRKLMNKLQEKNYNNIYMKSKVNGDPRNCLSSLQQISKFEIDHYLLNTLLRDSDVMSMTHSLELRPILLDHVLVETGFAMPDNYKIKDGLNKAVFIEALRDLIPKKVWQRKKTGFEMPYATWMNHALKDRLMDAVNSKGAKEIFKKSYIDRMKKRSKKGNICRSFWKDFVLLEWLNN